MPYVLRRLAQTSKEYPQNEEVSQSGEVFLKKKNQTLFFFRATYTVAASLAPSLPAGVRRLQPAIAEFVRRLRTAGAGLSPGCRPGYRPGRSSLTIASPSLSLPSISKGRWSLTKTTLNISECDRRINFIRSLAGATRGCHPGMLLRLYQTAIRPVLEYGAGLVDPCTKHNRNKLQRIASRQPPCASPSGPSPPRRGRRVADRLLLRWRSERSAPVGSLHQQLQVLVGCPTLASSLCLDAPTAHHHVLMSYPTAPQPSHYLLVPSSPCLRRRPQVHCKASGLLAAE